MSILHAVSGAKRAPKSNAIFSAAFSPMSVRTPRSIEFMEGALASLKSCETTSDVDFSTAQCPYSAGTTAHDAWHAGSEEGRRLWRINSGLLDSEQDMYEEFKKHIQGGTP